MQKTQESGHTQTKQGEQVDDKMQGEHKHMTADRHKTTPRRCK